MKFLQKHRGPFSAVSILLIIHVLALAASPVHADVPVSAYGVWHKTLTVYLKDGRVREYEHYWFSKESLFVAVGPVYEGKSGSVVSASGFYKIPVQEIERYEIKDIKVLKDKSIFLTLLLVASSGFIVGWLLRERYTSDHYPDGTVTTHQTF